MTCRGHMRGGALAPVLLPPARSRVDVDEEPADTRGTDAAGARSVLMRVLNSDTSTSHAGSAALLLSDPREQLVEPPDRMEP